MFCFVVPLGEIEWACVELRSGLMVPLHENFEPQEFRVRVGTIDVKGHEEEMFTEFLSAKRPFDYRMFPLGPRMPRMNVLVALSTRPDAFIQAYLR